MSNTIVHIIEGNPNAGKTVTAWLVYLQLLQKGQVEFFYLFRDGQYDIPKMSEEPRHQIETYTNEDGKPSPYDFCAIVKIATSRVAIFSAGDNDVATNHAFDWLKEINPAVFVGCCRSHGNSSARQALLAHKDEYRFVFHRVYSDYTTADYEFAQRDRLPLAEDIAETILASFQEQHIDSQNIVLQSIRLKNLWGKYDIEWPLSRHINILTGDNGSGKSTLLYTLYVALRNPKNKNRIWEKSDGIDITFADGTLLSSIFLKDKISAYKEGARDSHMPELTKALNEIISQVEAKYQSEDLQDVVIQSSFSVAINPDGSAAKVADVLSNTKVDLIRTFDIFKYSEDKQVEIKPQSQSQIVSELDSLLRTVLERYAYYIGQLGDRALRVISEGKQDDVTRSIMKDKDTFLSIMNSFLGESGKSVITDQGTLRFKIESSSSVIDAYSLSSGEKQLLYIMLTVLLEEKHNYILILDEPELSMHVGWQRKLINTIKNLNPNCQIIMATHSPAIYAEGYHSFINNIEDIRTIRNE